ncbi:toll-like receptor 8 [Bombina bombina]|uniref:toll-like receptor 8 n=1 Tax=Bombina bombina TaxID=8345 RepID=UPI00235AA391|nr:toll-like receptor 8 [Bombina bombina]
MLCSSLGFPHHTQDNRTLPCSIEQNISSITFNCSAGRLKKVPIPIEYVSESTILLLSDNNLHSLSKESFQDWSNLTKLGLSRNRHLEKTPQKSHKCTKVLKIRNGTFSNLTQLKELYIDQNNLCKIPTGLPVSLQVLSLKYNTIFNISNKSLSRLKYLKKLKLGHNCYYSNKCNLNIEDGAFSELTQLTVLSLPSNNLIRVPHNLPSSLIQLYLGNNKIQVIGRDDFYNLTNLELLNLSGNCPRCFNAAYLCIPCTNPSYIQINDYAFQNLRNLTQLNLASTSLRSVPQIWFKNTTKLKVLDLRFNYLINEIASAEFLHNLTFLEILDLSYNYELKLYPKTINLSDNFSKLVSLKQFFMQGYVFKEITNASLAPLTMLKNLNVIDFGVNFIRQINFNVFLQFPNLTSIKLSENKISPIYENCNQSRVLETFQTHTINKNSIDNYVSAHKVHTEYVPKIYRFDFEPETTKYSSYGKTLDLSLNSIFYIDPEQFRPFQDIECLNLSSNGLGQDLNGTEFIYLSNLKYLDLSFNKLDFASINAFSELFNLEVLDVSYNKHYFVVEGVVHHLKFIENLQHLKMLNLKANEISTLTEAEIKSNSLEELNFSQNRLDVLWKSGDGRYLDIFGNFSNLTILDISHNRLHKIPSKALRNLPKSLQKLFLNDNDIEIFEWELLKQLENLKFLDLSNNQLAIITGNLSNQTNSLQKIILKSNRIFQLPVSFLHNVRSLINLDLSNNLIETINKSVFLSGNENYLNVLELEGNPFDCNCGIIEFLSWIKKNNVTIPRLATDVTCATPIIRKGESIIYFDVKTCNLGSVSLMLFLLSFVLAVHIIALPIMKHLLFWDLWFLYHFCATKLKWRKVGASECLYDAFVAYDTKDLAVSDWVLNELCYHVERKGDRHILLCLEERDWEPGKAIIDNLVHSINQSKKTIFVLTKDYIKSGKFKTTFYLALQKLIDENMDVIVIVLLQPVLQNSQYLRFRKKICKSSILEWPKNPHAEVLFWQKMRNVVITENYTRYNHLYTDRF